MRQISRLMKSNCRRDGSMSRGNTWDGRLKCHEAGKRHEKLILWANHKECPQVFLNVTGEEVHRSVEHEIEIGSAFTFP